MEAHRRRVQLQCTQYASIGMNKFKYFSFLMAQCLSHRLSHVDATGDIWPFKNNRRGIQPGETKTRIHVTRNQRLDSDNS
jgi:hypothetical protein